MVQCNKTIKDFGALQYQITHGSLNIWRDWVWFPHMVDYSNQISNCVVLSSIPLGDELGRLKRRGRGVTVKFGDEITKMVIIQQEDWKQGEYYSKTMLPILPFIPFVNIYTYQQRW